MLKINEEKRPEEQGILFHDVSIPEVGHIQESEGDITEIRNLKSENIIFFFYYYQRYNGAKDMEKLDINYERDYDRYKYQNSISNLLLNLDSSQVDIKQNSIYFLYIIRFFQAYFQNENNHFLLSCLENNLLYMDSSQEKYKHNILDNLSNIDMLEDINLKMFKETNLVSSFRILLYKIVLNKVILYILLVIDIMLMIFIVICDYERREEKRREEKRREEKIVTRGGRRK